PGAAARRCVGPRRAAVPLDGVAIDDLVGFFGNPSRWFLQGRLGVYVGGDAELLAEREPIELNGLEQWRVGDALLRRALRAGDPETAWAVLRAGGLLPLGTPGRCAVDDATVRATALADAAC